MEVEPRARGLTVLSLVIRKGLKINVIFSPLFTLLGEAEIKVRLGYKSRKMYNYWPDLVKLLRRAYHLGVLRSVFFVFFCFLEI